MVVLYLAAALVLAATILALFLAWGSNWGATPEERAQAMPGDAYLADGPPVRVAMTRAISIQAEPEIVWPWLAQLGRGAGWYSIDRLDNGGKDSARHIVSWVPPPEVGDASPVGYLRHIEPGRALVWWLGGLQYVGATTRLVTDIQIAPEQGGTRLITRMSADAAGRTARVSLLVFRFIDSIMASRQLLGIQRRIERYEARHDNPEVPETGARDQYQLYEVIYASGESAGVTGKEHAADWRQTAIEDGVLSAR
ncbi:MAG: hypothetical protein HKM89_14575 [Gemmatimonadales bacterium]|nr:hypothetical protein [Gemmatimonadales bacterium]